MTTSSSYIIIIISNLYFLTFPCNVIAQSGSRDGDGPTFTFRAIWLALLVFTGFSCMAMKCFAATCCRSSERNFESTNEHNDDSVRTEDLEKRKDNILSKIIQKKVICEDDVESNVTENTSSSHNDSKVQKGDIHLTKSPHSESLSSRVRFSIRSILSSQSYHSPQICAICLEEYAEGDDICWSPNSACGHAFHLSCMTQWLMKNKHCPICRSDYLKDTCDNDQSCDCYTTSSASSHSEYGHNPELTVDV